MRLAALFFTAILFAPSISAAEMSSPDAAVALTDRAMQHIASGDFSEGINLLRPYTTTQKTDLDSMIAQAEINMPTMIERYGKSIGYELIRNDTVGNSLIQVFLSTTPREARSSLAFHLIPRVKWLVNQYVQFRRRHHFCALTANNSFKPTPLRGAA